MNNFFIINNYLFMFMEKMTVNIDNNTTKDDYVFLKEFKYSKNNNNFSINLGKHTENKIIIKIKSLLMIKECYYQNIYNLDELRGLHKSFRYFDTIDEALTSFIDIFESNKYELDIKEDEKMFLVIKIPKFGQGEETITIEMKKNILSINNICENLIQKINNLDKQMNELIKEINLLKEENKNKDEIIKELKEWKDSIIKKEKEKEELKIYKIDSKIIEKKEELDLLINRLRNNINIKDKKFYFKLIFRGTQDGKTSQDFHRKCDGIGMTISVIKTNSGYKFGGYAEKAWKSEGSWITDDENAFVFSLNHMKIYNAVKDKYKYYFGKLFGPNFYSFWPRQDMFATSGNNVLDKNTANQYFSGFNSDYELNGGVKDFKTQELEVFQLMFI